VAPYLQQLGVKPSWWWRLRLRLLGWTAKRRAKRRAGRRRRELRLL
jgi:hypothetical protein